MKILLNGSAFLAVALLISFLIPPRSLDAKTLLSQIQSTIEKATTTEAEENSAKPNPETADTAVEEEVGLTAPTPYIATAYSLRGRTASGTPVRKGIIAADPKVLPLGSKVRLEAGAYSGEYLVADTGGAVKGKKIDIWTPSTREAMRFGRRKIKLTVLSWGPKRAAKKQRLD